MAITIDLSLLYAVLVGAEVVSFPRLLGARPGVTSLNQALPFVMITLALGSFPYGFLVVPGICIYFALPLKSRLQATLGQLLVGLLLPADRVRAMPISDGVAIRDAEVSGATARGLRPAWRERGQMLELAMVLAILAATASIGLLVMWLTGGLVTNVFSNVVQPFSPG